VFGQVSSKCPLDFRFVLEAPGLLGSLDSWFLGSLVPGMERDTGLSLDGFYLLHLAVALYLHGTHSALVYICINIYTDQQMCIWLRLLAFSVLALGAIYSHIHWSFELPM